MWNSGREEEKEWKWQLETGTTGRETEGIVEMWSEIEMKLVEVIKVTVKP